MAALPTFNTDESVVEIATIEIPIDDLPDIGTEKPILFFKPFLIDVSECHAYQAVITDRIKPGDVIIIRYEGPRGAPGMREMIMTTDALVGMGKAQDTFVVTDGRFSGFTEGSSVGHVAPEAAVGGPIGVVEDGGDPIVIDIPSRKLDLDIA